MTFDDSEHELYRYFPETGTAILEDSNPGKLAELSRRDLASERESLDVAPGNAIDQILEDGLQGIAILEDGVEWGIEGENLLEEIDEYVEDNYTNRVSFEPEMVKARSLEQGDVILEAPLVYTVDSERDITAELPSHLRISGEPQDQYLDSLE